MCILNTHKPTFMNIINMYNINNYKRFHASYQVLCKSSGAEIDFGFMQLYNWLKEVLQKQKNFFQL